MVASAAATLAEHCEPFCLQMIGNGTRRARLPKSDVDFLEHSTKRDNGPHLIFGIGAGRAVDFVGTKLP